MNMIQKLKKNKKGFTLVELLVVLVILAILAAAIIPSMMGFIDKAKEESRAAECRNVLLASDVVLNELYGKGGMAEGAITGHDTEIQNIAGVSGSVSGLKIVKDNAQNGHYIVSEITYKTADNIVYKYALDGQQNGSWTKTATDDTPSSSTV